MAFARRGSTEVNRFLIPRHKANNIQSGNGHKESLLGNALKCLVNITGDAFNGVGKDSYFSSGGDTGEVYRIYRRNLKENLANYRLNDDAMLKVCFLAWRGISCSRRFNPREVQLERLAKILSTKAELDDMLKPRALKRRGAIGVYTFLSGVRISLLKCHFDFWRTAKHKQRRKLVKYFDKWNVWASVQRLRRFTATRFMELVAQTSLLRRNRMAYKKFAYDRWVRVSQYTHRMRTVALLFRVWATQTASAVLNTRRKCKMALQEWRRIAKTNHDQREAYLERKKIQRLLVVFGGWRHTFLSAQAKKEVQTGSHDRVDDSAVRRGDSSDSVISRVDGNDKHDLGSLSGMTEEPPSKADESSVLQASLASVSVSSINVPRGSVSSIPHRSTTSTPPRKTTLRTPTRTSSGYGQSPCPSKLRASPSTKQDKQALWRKRMEKLKNMSEAFEDVNAQRLRASGL